MNQFSQWLEANISLPNYDTPHEEKANALTHLFGAVLSLVGWFFLLQKGSVAGNPSMTAGLLVFGTTMVLLYTASGLYHLAPASPLKRLLRIFDHSNIYFLIAGTYTPILIAVDTSVSRIFVAVVWGIAALGIVFTLVFWGRLKPLHVVLYLLMGWMVVFIWKPVSQRIPTELLLCMVGGGLAYSLGTIFYALKKKTYFHAIWHLFVLAGSLFFFFGIYLFLPV